MSTPVEPEPSHRRPWWKRKWGIALIVFVVLAALGALVGEEEPDPVEATEVATEPPAPEPTVEPEPTSAPTPTPTPEPTPEPPAIPPPTPEEPATLEGALADALGDSNREVERFQLVNEGGEGMAVDVTVAFNDNLTEGMIKGSARSDTRDILQVIATMTDLVYEQVRVEGMFPLVDQLGNSEEARVVMATYDRATIDQINFDNFLTDNVWEVARSSTIHPAFQP